MEALPIGPLRVPNKVFRDFGLSREVCGTAGLAMVVVRGSPIGDDVACSDTET